jgi:hypothetical protein
MIKALLALHLLLVSVLAPRADFHLLADLSSQFDHCKTYEDCDMGLADFVVDHLINIDAFFDGHQQSDEQRPHHPIRFGQASPHFLYILPSVPLELPTQTLTVGLVAQIPRSESIYLSAALDDVFHPPVNPAFS